MFIKIFFSFLSTMPDRFYERLRFGVMHFRAFCVVGAFWQKYVILCRKRAVEMPVWQRYVSFRRVFVRHHFIFACVVIVVVGLSWFWATWQKYNGYVGSADTAVAEQAIWNTIFTGRLFYQSFLEIPESNLREHLNIIQFLYVPFYALVPHTLTLFAVIQVFFVAAAIVLYWYVYRRLGIGIAWLLLAFFLLHPLTHIQTIGPMHVVAVGGPLFLFLLIAYEERWYKTFVGLCVAMALVSEFVAPTLFLVGILALWQGRSWQWVLPPIFFGISLYLVARWYITIGFGSQQYLSEKMTLAWLLNIPKFDQRVEFVLATLAPIGYFFPLFSRYAILLLPSFAIALFIIIYGRIAGGSHVFVLIPPVLTMIAFLLLMRWRETWKAKAFSFVLVCGLVPSVWHFYDRMSFVPSAHAAVLEKAILAVKDDGSVTADSSFGQNLNRRPEFFIPDNYELTDYVVIKQSKYADKKNNDQPEMEQRKESYRDQVEGSGLYRVVFADGRVRVYVKKEKIVSILGIGRNEIDAISDEELQKRWERIPSQTPKNIFGMPMPR